MPQCFCPRLIENLCRKRDLLEKNDPKHEEIKTGLVILSGGMRGVSGAAMSCAFHALGFGKVFDFIFSVSTGAPTAGFFLSGFSKMILGTSLYYQELVDNGFIRYPRFLYGQPIADIDLVENVLRHGLKNIDVPIVKAHRSEFLVAVTRVSDGTGFLVNAKKVPDMIQLIKGSVAMPGLSHGSVNIPLKEYGDLWTDGALGLPFPVQEAVEQYGINNLVIIANESREAVYRNRRTLREKIFTPLLLRKTPVHLKQLVLDRRNHYQDGISYLESKKEAVYSGILWSPPSNVHLLTTNKNQLRELAIQSAQKTFEIFGQPKKTVILL